MIKKTTANALTLAVAVGAESANPWFNPAQES
jgi:hypothetical protein